MNASPLDPGVDEREPMAVELPLGVTWPPRDAVARLARERRAIPVARRYLADAETPVGLYRRLTGAKPGTFLLESALLDGTWAHYSLIGIAAQAVLLSDAGAARWEGKRPAQCPATGAFSAVLGESMAALASPRLTGLGPLTGGFVGSLGYDTVREWENVGERADRGSDGLPEAYAMLVRDLAIMDHRDSTVTLISVLYPPAGAPDAEVERAYDEACDRLAALAHAPGAAPEGLTTLRDGAKPAQATQDGPREEGIQTPKDGLPDGEHPQVVAAFPGYREGVCRALDAIRDGEVFQLVLSQRFELASQAAPLDVYRALRASNPSPYLYLLSCADSEGRPYAIVGASPEALVTRTGRRVVAHPIAGTRPRGEDSAADRRLELELLADDKERAEHLMLVDLARNDLARVCRPGTVRVEEFMQVEHFSRVMHIVSTVAGEVASSLPGLDVIRAAFPAGTLTGAPKIRAMQLIDQWEPTPRGPYGGVVGYLDVGGDLDTAIAIRTAVLRPGRAIVQAGAGIVADSDPATEDAECRAKASAVIRAIGLAARFDRL